MGLKSWIVTKAIQGKLPLWIYRTVGRFVGRKLNLQEGSMADPTPTIRWYQSKAVWTAIIGAVLGLVQPITTALGHPYQIPLWVFEFLGGLGLYSLRTANTNVTK